MANSSTAYNGLFIELVNDLFIGFLFCFSIYLLICGFIY